MPSSKPSDATLRLIVESYQRLTGKPLIPTVPTDANALRTAIWEAPRAIVAHGTEADPIFFYGNRLALQLFEMSEDEFARLPSRLSAEPMAQEARVKLLEKVTQQGYIDGYSGMRIAKSGKRFMITDTTVWNLLDEAGVHHGQAAVFVMSA
ncbi:MAG: MEKHLA domain-containing protein [Sideroxydans sp.]|nr:MEKHLA domain-containing protein [Sideroxydans sp.]